MAWLLVWAGVAGAACEPTDQAGFAALVDEAQAAIDQDDPLAHERAWRELQRHVPCLTEPVSPERWATFLYSLAVVESLRGEDWRPTLDVALQTWPELEQAYGGPELEGYVGQPAPPAGPPLPAPIWIDGHEARASRDLPGTHLVQRERDGAWDNLLLRDEPLPEDWRIALPPPPDPGGGQKPKRGRPGLIAAGAGVLAAGTATALASYFPGKAAKEAGETPTALTVANTAGWSLAGIGGGVAVLGVVLPAQSR